MFSIYNIHTEEGISIEELEDDETASIAVDQYGTVWRINLDNEAEAFDHLTAESA